MRASKSFPNNLPLPLVEEVKYCMHLNGIYYSDLLCTPHSIEELVIGNLYINSNIQAVSDIESIRIKGYKIEVETREASCACDFSVSKEPIVVPAIKKLQKLAEQMFSMAEIYSQYGGIHCSALSDGKEIIGFKEDIGRHNAFDKVVGAALLEGYELKSLIYITSGRVNHEVMTKAVSCRLPLVVSRSIMSSAAYDLAEKRDVRVIGRILSPEPVCYEGSINRCLKR